MPQDALLLKDGGAQGDMLGRLGDRLVAVHLPEVRRQVLLRHRRQARHQADQREGQHGINEDTHVPD